MVLKAVLDANNVFAFLQTLSDIAESRTPIGVMFLVSCVLSFDVCVVLLVILYVNRSVS